jgi:hypothetical protein
MRRGIAVAALAGLFTVICAGCSAVPANPRAVLEQKASSIDTAAQDLLDLLRAAGLSTTSARGVIDTCQSEPAPGVSYRAGIAVRLGDDLVTGFGSLVKQLEETGWEETDAYRDVELDPDKPAGRYERGDITLDIKTGGFKMGETPYGADEMDLGITIKNACVRIPDGKSFLDYRDLEKDIQPRS